MVSIKPADSALAQADLSGASLTVTGDESTNAVNIDGSASITVELSGATINTGKNACIELVNADGKTVATWWGEGNGGSSTWSITLPESVSAGVYTVKVSTTKNFVESTLVAIDETANGFWAGYTVTPSTNQPYFTETGKAVDFSVEKVMGLDNEETSDYVVKYYKASSEYDTQDKIDSAFADTSSGDIEKFVSYFANEANLVNGNGSAPSEASDDGVAAGAAAGKFIMAVFPADSELAGVTAPQAFYFEIYPEGDVQQALSVYDKTSGIGASDTTFTYDGDTDFLDGVNGSAVLGNIGLTVNGEVVDLYGASGSSADSVYKVSTVDFVDVSASTTAKEAGEYVLGITTGTSDTVVGYVTLAVEKFDVSKATVSVSDTNVEASNANTGIEVTLSYNGATITKYFKNGVEQTDDTFAAAKADGWKLSVDSYEPAVGSGAAVGYKGYFAYAGTYGFTLTPDFANNADDKSNFAMSGEGAKGEVRMIVNGKAIESSFSYTGKHVSGGSVVDADVAFGGVNAGAEVLIDKSKGIEFDLEQITWGSGTAYNGKNATITVTDVATGEVVSDATAAGSYKVTVQLPTGVKYDQGGSSYFFVNVINGSATKAYFTIDGKPSSTGATVDFDGQAIPYTVLIKLDDEAGTVLKQGTDYTVKLERKNSIDDTKWTEVDEAKDPGEYRISVVSSKYDLSGISEFEFTVNASDFEGVEAVAPTYGYKVSDYLHPYAANGKSFTANLDQVSGFAYTGSAVAPALKLYVTDSNGEKVYFDLPSDCYEATYKLDGKTVAASEVVKADDGYTVDIKIDEEALENLYGVDAAVDGDYDVTGIQFSIVDTIPGGFSDVKASDWYADEATKAKQLGYMTGLSGTSMLMPNADITRADVAMVLMRMAGGNPSMANEETKYDSIFSDVSADAYYAKAINWAYKAGIVTGDADADTFRPNDKVTREELATMLGRFAQNVMGEAVSAGEIDGYADAASVQDFAKAGMSWCVENEVFGVNTDVLDPQGNASRAQVAAIAVRVMPAVEK